ncbi:MAG TPA: ice-binding family protein [Fimbriimonadaceae bacterium]|nr:ice-binding family protein [Fimbriimonadaceae bacterium]
MRTTRFLAALAASILGGLPMQADAQILGTAESYAVLAGETITNTGPTVLQGDLGLAPGTSVTGFPPGTVTGNMNIANSVALQAQIDLTTAYNYLADLPSDADLSDLDLGGRILLAGTYTFSSSAQLTGLLQLDAQGDADARWVFQIGSTLTTASASQVLMLNGGDPCNVYWQVGSSATLGTETAFLGHIVALTSITMNTGATILGGSALARNGSVTLDSNIIMACEAAVIPGPAAALPWIAGLLGTYARRRRK